MDNTKKLTLPRRKIIINKRPNDCNNRLNQVVNKKSISLFRLVENLHDFSVEEINWEFLLERILEIGRLDIEELSKFIFIAKLDDDNSFSERDKYSIVLGAEDFMNIKKLAIEKKCPFSMIIKKFNKNFMSTTMKKLSLTNILKDILTPNSAHLSINILNSKLSPKKETINNFAEIDVMKDNVLECIKSLTDFREHLDSFSAGKSCPKINRNRKAVYCNVCDKYISVSDIQYQCSSCVNYFLCSQCEIFSDQVHNDQHIFLKIKPSKDINFTDKPYNPDLCDFKSRNSSSYCFNIEILPNEQLNLDEYGSPYDIYEKETSLHTGFKKTWFIRNKGLWPWSSNITLREVSGNIRTIDHKKVYTVPCLKSGEKGTISIKFEMPQIIENDRRFHSVWQFYCNDQMMNKFMVLNVLAKANKREELEHRINERNKKAEILSELDYDDSNSDDESVIFPPCFNMNIPFSIELKDKSNETYVKICKEDELKTKEKSSISDFSIEYLLMRPSTSKGLVNNTKKVDSNQVSPSIKCIKPNTKVNEKMAANSSIEGIKSENGSKCLNKKSKLSKEKLAKRRELKKERLAKKSNELNIPKSMPKPPQSKSKSQENVQSEIIKNATDHLGRILPNVNGLVTKTISNILDMIVIPSTSNGNNTPERFNDSSERLADALQKLFEMGFCNETLNENLLIKNNFDIQATVRDLLQSSLNEEKPTADLLNPCSFD
ncbi:hypothetical protein BLOT_003634 [Blomia tropicalis]|nr:hypothetical protein BLOT_003634 [Blomia tropicalis]